MKNTFYPLTFGRAKRGTRGFSLVEVTLAVAVVAIGLLGILGLFPLGMDAVRQAADATQMMAIGQDNLAYFQEEAANSNYYAMLAPGVYDPTKVIDPASSFGSYSSNLIVDGISYRVEAIVTNSPAPGSGLSSIWAGPTNTISRVQVGVYRIAITTVFPFYKPIGNTNFFITEVARYVE